jgi:hypothetical protein
LFATGWPTRKYRLVGMMRRTGLLFCGVGAVYRQVLYLWRRDWKSLSKPNRRLTVVDLGSKLSANVKRIQVPGLPLYLSPHIGTGNLPR